MMVSTLSRYIGLRFLRTIAAVFGGIFGLIFILDFVEMLRRAADLPGATTPLLAAISFLRTPAIAEKILPFVMLGAAMIALVNLTRRLELVVARSAGVSVWQFLTPVVVIALAIGIFATTVYNPVSAFMKLRADRIETKIAGRTLKASADAGLWIRQRSFDGQSILRAETSSDGGTNIGVVTAFVYDRDGHFIERVEAARGRHTPGAWELYAARINKPGENPRGVDTYRLATNLTAEQVTQTFIAPDAVAFWDLMPLVRRSEAAGLDANKYYLKFQELMARPLLLAAMVFIAASFSLRFFRFGGIARMVSGGVASGFVLYVATKLASDLGGAGLLSAPVAAWLPAILGTMLGVLVLLHLEDG
jgi:lipopolysaccharide export system permease protein